VSLTYLPHPAFELVLRAERAFTADPQQAEERAVLIVRALAMEGHLPDVEFRHGTPMIAAEAKAGAR
jgi:hypothetical protein